MTREERRLKLNDLWSLITGCEPTDERLKGWLEEYAKLARRDVELQWVQDAAHCYCEGCTPADEDPQPYEPHGLWCVCPVCLARDRLIDRAQDEATDALLRQAAREFRKG